jgi:malonyl-CoA/methylmalonyl-CoA synthetase
MTETGMLLTKPLLTNDIPGVVGEPFDSVKVGIADPDADHTNGTQFLALGDVNGTEILSKNPGNSIPIKFCLLSLYFAFSDAAIEGELMVQGPTVFSRYWQKESATQDAFTPDGWFKTGKLLFSCFVIALVDIHCFTGDTASFCDGVYHILGRTSVDIIKSAGYKISALDIERHLLAHPSISDCAVVGLDDAMYGQKVAAVVVLERDASPMELQELNEWLSNLIPAYQLPRELIVLETMPRSLIGKVNKKDLVREVFGEGQRA